MVIKIKGNQTITLVEENKTITDKEKLLQTFNEYFVDIIPSLGITYFWVNNDDVNNDKINNTITNFEDHRSKGAIKKQMG